MEPVDLISFDEFKSTIKNRGLAEGTALDMTTNPDADGNDLYKYSKGAVLITYSVNRFWYYTAGGEACGCGRDLTGAIAEYEIELEEIEKFEASILSFDEFKDLLSNQGFLGVFVNFEEQGADTGKTGFYMLKGESAGHLFSIVYCNDGNFQYYRMGTFGTGITPEAARHNWTYADKSSV